jgi:hypothetical protein
MCPRLHHAAGNDVHCHLPHGVVGLGGAKSIPPPNSIKQEPLQPVEELAIAVVAQHAGIAVPRQLVPTQASSPVQAFPSSQTDGFSLQPVGQAPS